MRCVAAIALVVGCGGAPAAPARLEEVGNLPDIGPDLPAAFDFDDTLIVMDPSTGLRRFADGRLLSVTGGANFTFGQICVDGDGTLLVSSSNFGTLARLEPGDMLKPIMPAPPTTFTRCTGTPSGAYHILPFGAATTLTLAVGGASWIDSMKAIDRTVRAPDGTMYAVLDGDIVVLGSDDSAEIVASCAEFAGGTCPNLELGGVDGAGGIHMAITGLPDVHVLDPGSGTYRDIVLPGGLLISSLVAGSQYALVAAIDPERNNELSLWVLLDGSDELLRFATIGAADPRFLRLVMDHAGTGHVIAGGKLQRVVLD
jgi:hypothetical protein